MLTLLRFFGTLVVALTASQAHTASLQWGDLRDGVLHLRPDTADQVQISWQPAWQSDANHEQLYLLDGSGQLVQQVEIPAEQASGSLQIALQAAHSDYRLSIPGYSFRRYRIRHAATTASQFEPTKVHFSAEVNAGVQLYFKVEAGERAILAGKYYDGVDQLQAIRVEDGLQVNLALRKYSRYGQFDQIELPVAEHPQVWQLTLGGSGKAAFWLDGTANLFAQNAQQLYQPHWQPGQVRLALSEEDIGPTPKLGIALPYAMPPTSSFAHLEAIGARAASYYSFVDVLGVDPQREADFRQLYRTRFEIRHDLTLLAGTNRRAELSADSTTLAGLNAWLNDSLRLDGQGLHYLAFADEPNLNYPDYATFASYFAAMLEQVQAHPGVREAGVRIALPASSRWLDGPLRSDAAQRRGIDWARRLLETHGDSVDALAWHEWMVRDLLATRRYRDSVRQAADLVGLDQAGRPRKALLLDQTNISSGADLSPYQQDTHFASLWWASVVINAAQDGLLDMLNWFQAADEDEYPKGMLRHDGLGGFELKPVGKAQHFITRYWLAEVQGLDNSAFEVDALAMREGGRHSLLGVNKVARLQRVELSGAGGLCAGHAELQLLSADSQPYPGEIACAGDRATFEIPGETLFALSWKIP